MEPIPVQYLLLCTLARLTGFVIPFEGLGEKETSASGVPTSAKFLAGPGKAGSVQLKTS